MEDNYFLLHKPDIYFQAVYLQSLAGLERSSSPADCFNHVPPHGSIIYITCPPGACQGEKS